MGAYTAHSLLPTAYSLLPTALRRAGARKGKSQGNFKLPLNALCHCEAGSASEARAGRPIPPAGQPRAKELVIEHVHDPALALLGLGTSRLRMVGARSGPFLPSAHRLPPATY